MINTQLRDQLKAAVLSKQIEVKYPDGYKQWKEKFDYFFSVTKDVKQTLDCMYGPNGGVDNYKGSIYVNSNLDISQIAKPKPNSKKKHHYRRPEHKPTKSGAFGFLKVKEGNNNGKTSIPGRVHPSVNDNLVPRTVGQV